MSDDKPKHKKNKGSFFLFDCLSGLMPLEIPAGFGVTGAFPATTLDVVPFAYFTRLVAFCGLFDLL